MDLTLPEDCLTSIFLKLDSTTDRESFGLTCHRFLQIQNTTRKSLEFGCSFTRFNHFETTIPIDSFILDKLIKRFTKLQLLNLSGCTNLQDSGLTQLQNHGSNLKSLYLDCCFKISDTGLSSIAFGCQFLSFISLYRCPITDNGLHLLAKSCSSLQSLNLERCSLITDGGISAITTNCRHLCAVKISHCDSIKGIGFNNCSPTLACVEADSCRLEPEGILGILSGGGVEYLNVSNLHWCIRGNGLGLIGGGFGSKITVLDFRVCRSVDDESVVLISKGCPLLKEWNLSLCSEVGVVGWEGVGGYCGNLERLHVNGCRGLCDRGLLGLSNGCKRLLVLYMSRCREVSSLAVEMFKIARMDVEIKGEEVMCIMPKHFF